MKIKNIIGVVIGVMAAFSIGLTSRAQTFNLHTLEPNTAPPGGSTLEWHSALPVGSGNLIANPAAVNAGLYYAVYKYTTCYSSPSPFKLVKADCSTGMTDLYASVDTTDKPAGTMLKFHTAKPVGSSNIYSGNAHAVPSGTYYASYYDAVKDCYTMASPIRVIPNMICGTNPDMNTTHLNVAVSGNVNTNDNVPVGSTYGTPVAAVGNPSTTLPVMNANGTYTFTPPNAGVYTFNVPVCSPDTALGCVNETLTITVTNPYINNNPPIVNPDVATVDSGSSVNIPVLVNDAPGNPGGSLGTPTATDPPHGTTSTNPDGTIHYTPDPGFTGIDTFTYTVCDTVPNPDSCKTTTVTVNVNAGNAANTILANDDFDKTPMNTVATGNVKTNDIDPDGDPMKVTTQNITIPAGTFVLDTLGNYTFTPVNGFTGPVQIPYTICDTAGHCATATLHVLVDPVMGLNPDFNVTHVNVQVGGNMANNDQLMPGSSFGTPVANAGNPNTAVPTMNADGTYSFTPTVPGVYVFNVPVCPSGVSVNCPMETLTITATNPYINNNPPVVNPDVTSVDSGSSVNVPVLVNDAPGNIGGSLGTPTATDPPHGTTSTNADGTIKYTPDPGFTGVDTFTYTVCDTVPNPDLCKTTTVTVNVNSSSAPNTILANDDFAKIPMNTVANGNVKTNDIDPDGDPMVVTAQTNVSIPGAGVFSVNASGVYTFTPNAGFFGTVQIPYTICDNMSHCQTAVLHVVVDPVNILNPDFNVTNINVAVNGNMSTNDQLVPGSSFGTPIAATGNPTTAVPTLNSNGTYSFTPTDTGVYHFSVPVCPPGVTINCPIEQLTITVTNPYSNSNPPIINPDIASVDSGSSVNIPVLVNDQPGNPGGSLGTPVPSDPPHGTTSTNPDGTIKYTPDPGFEGVDTFTYTVCDTSLNPDKCKTTTVTVNVNPPGSSSNTIIANDDYANIQMNSVASGNVKTNDIDPDGDPMTVTAQSNVTIAEAGVFSVNASGVYTFTPNPGFFGTVQIPYTICDNQSHCQTATLHVVVNPVNTLNPDFNVTNINVPVNGNMSTNDQLVTGSSFGTPTATGNPSTDVPTMNANGTYSFNTDTAGVYTFNVPVCPPGVTISCPIETLTITVNNPNINTNPPVVNPDITSVDSGSSVNIPILVNDAPGNSGGSLGTPTVTDPPHGTVTVNTDGTVHYTPDPGFTGVDTFTYTVCDTSMNPDKCGTTTVTVHVNPPNLQNTTLGVDDYAYTFGTVPVSGNVLTNDTDPEGNDQSVTAQSISNTNGTFVLNTNGTYTFTPASGFTGALSFPYQVCDGGSPVACATATLHVLVDKAPDYTPSIFGASTLFTNSDTIRNFVAAIYNVNNAINKGQVKFRMSQSLPNKELILDPNMTVIDYNGSPVAVGNTDWNIVLNGSFYEFTLKPNVIFPANGVMYVGFKVKVPQSAPVNQIQPITATIIFQSGGDINFLNNNYTVTVTKN